MSVVSCGENGGELPDNVGKRRAAESIVASLRSGIGSGIFLSDGQGFPGTNTVDVFRSAYKPRDMPSLCATALVKRYLGIAKAALRNADMRNAPIVAASTPITPYLIAPT